MTLPFVDPVVWHAVAAALAAVFLLAGIAKLRDPGSFIAAVQGYELLPAWAVPAVAWGLIALELAAGPLLLFPDTRGGGATLAALVLAAALLAGLAGVLAGRAGIACGCSFGEEVPLGAGLLVRTAALLACALLLLLPVQPRPTVWIDLLGAVCLALFLFGLQGLVTTLMAHGTRLRSLREHP